MIKNGQKDTRKNPKATVIGSPIKGTQEMIANQWPYVEMVFLNVSILLFDIPTFDSHLGFPSNPIM